MRSLGNATIGVEVFCKKCSKTKVHRFQQGVGDFIFCKKCKRSLTGFEMAKRKIRSTIFI